MKSATWLISVATILGVSISNLVKFWADASFWVRFFFIIALCAAVVLAVLDAHTWWKGRATRYKTEEAVNKYMLKLLKRAGSVSIFANNLSWIRRAPEIREYLKAQAGAGRRICIFVPKHNDLTQEMAAEGVTIKTYPGLAYEPSARFTLLNPDEPGSSLLAIGKGTFPNFYIEEFSDQTHSRVLSVTRDLLKIMEKVSSGAKA
jgi:hypothetical protein